MFRFWAVLQAFCSACSLKRGNWNVEDIKINLTIWALRGHPASWHFEPEEIPAACSSENQEALFDKCVASSDFLERYASRAKKHFSSCRLCKAWLTKTIAEIRFLKDGLQSAD